MTVNQGNMPVRICVGIVSRDRRRMVENLLESISGLRPGDAFTFEVVLVENGPKVMLPELVSKFACRKPNITIYYFHEPKIGVVYARNMALEFALAHKFDKLAFADDDEIVDTHWLARLHEEQAEMGLDLIGGPVRPFISGEPGSLFQRVLWKNYKSRAQRIEYVSNAKKRNGSDTDIMLATNNWMLDLDFLSDHGQRFDMRYNLTGGEDSAFFAEIKKNGGKTGWAINAIVKEEIPLERLTVRYQFARTRDQSIVSLHRKYHNRPVAKWLFVPAGIIYKTLVGALMLALIPFSLGFSMLAAIRAFGVAFGRIAGLMGVWKEHYSKTTGH
jgi:glycosyltransferase involved in cell wall biosynthesis